MSLNIGDVVRFNTGKVEYTISEVNADGTVNLKGAKSNRKNVDTDSLTLVKANAVPVMTDADVKEVAEYLNADAVLAETDMLTDAEIQEIAEHVENPNGDVEIMAPWEIELLHDVNPARPFLLTVDGVISDHKTYNAAADALVIAARKGIQVYAVIDHHGERKATRTTA